MIFHYLEMPPATCVGPSPEPMTPECWLLMWPVSLMVSSLWPALTGIDQSEASIHMSLPNHIALSERSTAGERPLLPSRRMWADKEPFPMALTSSLWQTTSLLGPGTTLILISGEPTYQKTVFHNPYKSEASILWS